MNLTLSKRGDYVVRSALSLARAYRDGSQRKIREVVAEMGVPQTYASQILNDLVKTGIAESKSGKEGGYKLTKAPNQIRMLDIIEAGEGALTTDKCSLGDGPCRWDSVCPLHDIWYSATKAIRQVLENMTLQDLLDKDLLLESGNFVVPESTHRKTRQNIAISDWIQIETSARAVIDYIKSESNLSEIFLQCLKDIDSLRVSLDVLLPSWGPNKLDCVVKPATKDAVIGIFKEGQKDSQNSDTAYYSISFEAVTVSNLNIHSDLVGKVIAVDDDRSELHVKGSVRITEHNVSTNEDIESKLATAFIRTVLRKLAEVIE